MAAEEKNISIISSMGAGNKLDASQFQVADIYQTKVCPLAKVMRRELKKRNIEKLKVVYSEEIPVVPIFCADLDSDLCTECQETDPEPSMEEPFTKKRTVPGSVAFVPSVAGLIIAGEVIKDLVTVHTV